MYDNDHRAESPPLFDPSEFPAFRRVKPLPKRRRTSIDAASSQEVIAVPTLANFKYPLPGPDATAGELLLHTDRLAEHMAQSSFYMPILGGVQDLLRGSRDEEDGGPDDEARERRERRRESNNFNHADYAQNTKKRKVPANVSGSADVGVSSGEEPDGDEPFDERSSSVSTTVNTTGNNNNVKEDNTAASADSSPDNPPSTPTATTPPLTAQPKKKLSSTTQQLSVPKTKPKARTSPITQAGLARKDLVKTRKRQLSAVITALASLSMHTPTADSSVLALEIALCASYPTLSTTTKEGNVGGSVMLPLPVRLSKRSGVRKARAVKRMGAIPHPDAKPFMRSSFGFEFEKGVGASQRYQATLQEVSLLHTRFETELARQAAKAAKVRMNGGSNPTPNNTTKGGAPQAKAQRRIPVDSKQRTIDQNSKLNNANNSNNTTGNKKKKKKRSALANAGNPHHLRNYVPGRVFGAQTAPTANNNGVSMFSGEDIGVWPGRFLSAELPKEKKSGGKNGGRRKEKQKKESSAKENNSGTPATDAQPAMNNAEEWICAFCEYELFFGSEAEYRRSIERRKKVLRRRKRARERAAAATSGSPPTNAAPNSTRYNNNNNREESEYDDDNEYRAEEGVGGGGGAGGRKRWRAAGGNGEG